MAFDAVNFSVGVLALVVSVVGIVVSLLFYIRGKDSELAVKQTLSKIEASTTTLEKVTNRTIDRYTRYFTEDKREPSPELQIIASFFQTATTVMTNSSQSNQPPNVAFDLEFATRQLVATAYYSYLTNWTVQQLFPKDIQEVFNGNWQLHLKVLNLSKSDFTNAMQWFTRPDIADHLTRDPNLKSYYDFIAANHSLVIDETEFVRKSA